MDMSALAAPAVACGADGSGDNSYKCNSSGVAWLECDHLGGWKEGLGKTLTLAMPCGNEPTQINQWQHHGLTATEVSAVPRRENWWSPFDPKKLQAGEHLGIVSDMDPEMISKLAGYTTGVGKSFADLKRNPLFEQCGNSHAVRDLSRKVGQAANTLLRHKGPARGTPVSSFLWMPLDTIVDNISKDL
jgi:hypothetical protein